MFASRMIVVLAAAGLAPGFSPAGAVQAPAPSGEPAFVESVIPLRVKDLSLEEVRPPNEWVYRQNAVIVAPGLLITPRLSHSEKLLLAPGRPVATTPITDSVMLGRTAGSFGKPARLHDPYREPLRAGEAVTVVGRKADGSEIVLPAKVGVWGLELDTDLLTSRLQDKTGVEYRLAKKIVALYDGDDSWRENKIARLNELLYYELMSEMSGAGAFNAKGELVGFVTTVKIKNQKDFVFEGRSLGNISGPTVVTLRMFYSHQIARLLAPAETKQAGENR